MQPGATHLYLPCREPWYGPTKSDIRTLCLLQMAYMDLSLFLAAECASDKDSILFTDRLRHDCHAALMRLQCSPTTVKQR